MRQTLLPPTQLAPQTDRDEHFVPQTQKALAKTDPTPRSSTPTINYLGTMRLIEALRPLSSDAKPAQYNGIAEAQDFAAMTSGNPCGQRTYSNRWNSLRSVSS